MFGDFFDLFLNLISLSLGQTENLYSVPSITVQTMSRLYIIDTLRAHLKARDLTYQDLGNGIDLSEVSIKRMFTGADIGLSRLEQICQFLQIELADLFRASPRKRKLISRLTQAQEAEFANNKKLLMVAVCALNF